MKTRVLSQFFALGLAASVVSIATSVAADDPVVARMGSNEVKLSELKPSLTGLSEREQAALARDPALLGQLVRTLLVQQALVKQAEAANYPAQPEVAAKLERVRDTAIAEGYLQSVTSVPADYPSAAELQAAYQAAKANLVVPKQYRVAQVFIAVPKASDAATLKLAQDQLESVQAKLKQSGADFAAIARAESEEPESAARGGEIGWLTEAQVQPEIRSQVTSLAKGAVSAPVRLADGWHILKVVDIKDSYTASLDEVREQLIAQLRAAKQKANSEAYVADLLKKNPPALNELALSQLLPKAAQ